MINNVIMYPFGTEIKEATLSDPFNVVEVMPLATFEYEHQVYVATRYLDEEEYTVGIGRFTKVDNEDCMYISDVIDQDLHDKLFNLFGEYIEDNNIDFLYGL